MPSLTVPYAPRYIHPPSSNEKLDYADLAVIDFSLVGTTEGRTELAKQVKDALLTHGFFYIVNHGYTQLQTDRIFDIADIPLSGVSDAEKQMYVAKMKETGSYQGYKPRNYWHIDSGVRDQLEHYNINHDVSKRAHPDILRPYLPEVEGFCQYNHFNILHPLLRLVALSLELPEESLVDIHNYHAIGETYVRFMKYYPRSADEEEKTKNVWLKGHTDFGSITLLWSQPVGGLQIMTPDERWHWVRHIDNAIVVNAGDALEFLTGGYYKATIHRVVQPPHDQRNFTRLGVIYFALPDDDTKLIPLAESPVLQRSGIQRQCEDNQAPTMETWRRGRTSAYGQTDLKKGQREGVEEEVINGVVVKHYN
ncbi:hypothetical protein SERLA73DRAFT_105819 [Serpula lacrymans var. lacrymans S7.3]|uniref:Fe2OG dioxygenase domain-containing protein n=2 Tax=Serpula lacrymans var. lacrymans TaxID=341189 RepID=F8PRW7_SERL3|nr:uncharacterized protein SERLADRAFT_360899 [Serpula lacrymans var. lacrymans S7.9]EGO01202.1 hypothetical protein SERLA73DRAFT_105819 [Serpula lacrymans var. lacrymans S7.3]EGO26848.1 hypothetical protein SERLADRAFT_360899 [Serpula lacrymans var. lacrymans S7.9]